MKGTKIFRHESNPTEKQIHDSFIKEFGTEEQMARIGIGTHNGNNPIDYLDDHEKEIMINTVQWLGSPVGQGFLNMNGFYRQD